MPESKSLAVDVEVLYPQLASRLLALVGRNITAPPAVIEEACQVAWGRLHANREQVAPTAALGWLATTAMREALRMLRTLAHETSLDDPAHRARVITLPVREPGPDRMLELREQLAQVRRLPLRQRQMLWLQAVGYDYREIATETGYSRRTVERQLLRAKQRLARRARPDPDPMPRWPTSSAADR